MTDLIKLRDKLNAILVEDGMRPNGGRAYYDQTVRRRFSSRHVPLSFQDIIIAHNDSSDFNEFLAHAIDLAQTHVEAEDLNKWSDRVRQSIAKWRSKNDNEDTLTGVLGVDGNEINRFMTEPRRPDWHRPNQRP